MLSSWSTKSNEAIAGWNKDGQVISVAEDTPNTHSPITLTVLTQYSLYGKIPNMT